MTNLNCLTPLRAALFTVTTALALSACELPTKVGDLKGDESTGADTGDDSTADPPVTTGDETGSTTKPDATTAEPGETTGINAETTDTPSDCAGLDASQCAEQAGCMAANGTVYEDGACNVEPEFLGCLPEMPCDAVILTICRDGTDEVYQLFNGCVPAGFTPCEVDVVPCPDDCAGLDEASCAEFEGCQPVHGNPHVTENGMACVDVDTSGYLGCRTDGGACPPFIPTVCGDGKPEEPFDVPSGCIPPGWSECEGAGTPACM